MKERFIKCYVHVASGNESLEKASAIKTKEEFIILGHHDAFLAIGIIRLIKKLSSDEFEQLFAESEDVYTWLGGL